MELDSMGSFVFYFSRLVLNGMKKTRERGERERERERERGRLKWEKV